MNDMTTEYVAAFDAGTTALKGALVNGQGCIVASASSELDLIINGDLSGARAPINGGKLSVRPPGT